CITILSLQSCDRRARCYEECAATRTLAPGPPQARTVIVHFISRKKKIHHSLKLFFSNHVNIFHRFDLNLRNCLFIVKKCITKPIGDYKIQPVYSIAFNFKKACVYTPTPVFESSRVLLLFMKKAIIILYSRDRSEQKKGEEPRYVYTHTLRLDLIFILTSIYSFCRWLRCCLAVTRQMRPVHAKSPSFCRCVLPPFGQWIAKKFYSLNPSIPITRNIFPRALKSIRRVAVVIVLPVYVTQTCISEKILFYFATCETNARRSSSNSSSGSSNSTGNDNLRRNDIKYLYSATRACTGIIRAFSFSQAGLYPVLEGDLDTACAIRYIAGAALGFHASLLFQAVLRRVRSVKFKNRRSAKTNGEKIKKNKKIISLYNPKLCMNIANVKLVFIKIHSQYTRCATRCRIFYSSLNGLMLRKKGKIDTLRRTWNKIKGISMATREYTAGRSARVAIYYANWCPTESAGTGESNLKTCCTLKPTLIDGHKYTYPQELEKSSHVFVCDNRTRFPWTRSTYLTVSRAQLYTKPPTLRRRPLHDSNNRSFYGLVLTPVLKKDHHACGRVCLEYILRLLQRVFESSTAPSPVYVSSFRARIPSCAGATILSKRQVNFYQLEHLESPMVKSHSITETSCRASSPSPLVYLVQRIIEPGSIS
ncbi:unnamed protein product, partial [Trichogramma brassicae]